MGRSLRACGLAALLTLSLAAPAGAEVAPSRAAPDLARALAAEDTQITGGAFETIPPLGDPAAIADSELAGFPIDGDDYAVLSTGDAKLADDANASASTGVDNGGRGVRGPAAFDATVLKVDFTAPAGADCLSVGFKFLTEEFPEFVGGSFNDAFIAELDASNWTVSGSAISAPNNFASDARGNPVTVDSTGAQGLSPANAQGTTYDGATPALQASTRVTPGSHSLYLSIVDVNDSGYDSAVFLDEFVVGTAPNGDCRLGAQPLPDVARTVNVQVVEGLIRIRPPGGENFRRLRDDDQIAVGSTVDTTRGTVALTSASDARGGTQTANFFDGTFQVRQTRARRPVTELRLSGDGLEDCPSASGARRAAAAGRSRRKRRLWGDGEGRFRTRGRHSAAIVRGTRWLTEDRCNGTFTRVTEGTVSVRDFDLRRTVTVRAGQTYLARDRDR